MKGIEWCEKEVGDEWTPTFGDEECEREIYIFFVIGSPFPQARIPKKHVLNNEGNSVPIKESARLLGAQFR